MQIHLTVANIVTSVTNSKSFGDRSHCQRSPKLLEFVTDVANIVTSVTNSKSFGDRWQCERELLEGDNILDSIRDMLYQEVGEGKDSNLVHISRFPSLFGNVFHHQQWN